MSTFILECNGERDLLPAFSLTLDADRTTAIYSNTDIQQELLAYVKAQTALTVCAQEDGLYERLTVQDNIQFYRKWFGCSLPLAEILVKFQLQHCANKALRKCNPSEVQRVRFAKYFMMPAQCLVFVEPVHGVDLVTTNLFMEMLRWLSADGKSAVVLVSNMEHALLVGEKAFRLKENGLQEIVTETEPVQEEASAAVEATDLATPLVADLFKIPTKTADKVILFDPTEIDYIESQEGKAYLVWNDERFAMDASLAEMEKKLEMYGFYRCHRSYIVNLQKVREIITWSKNTYSLRLQNKAASTIPLSRTKVQMVQEIFNLK